MRNSALATAALTSVALFSQTAEAATPFTGGDGPSREEVQQRISSLYDRAETDTGNYNATRAMNSGTRRRAEPVRNGGGRSADPALDNVAKQWFDAARSQLGPTVPAVLPADRMPARPAAARPARPAERPGGGRERAARSLPELTAAPVPELTAGPATGRTSTPIAELTAGPATGAAARPVAELTAGSVVGAAPDPLAELTPAPPTGLPAMPQPRLDATQALPAQSASPRQASLRAAKERNQRKLTQARALLARHTARPSTPPTTVAALPAGDAWYTPQQNTPTATGDLPVGDTWGGAAGQTGLEAAWQQPQVADPPAYASVQADLPAYASVQTDLPTYTSVQADFVRAAGDTLGAAQAFGTTDARPAAAAELAIAFAHAQTGKPCVWGATGPGSYDAASLTRAAWNAAGVALPRTAPEQATAGTQVPLTVVEPGDLIFFYDTAAHVGICTGNGMMIHAPGPGTYIREESIFYAGESVIHSAVRPA
jgi:cell wall-associated NlpC family hydrolase